MKVRSIVSNTLDLWTLFEMAALCMVVTREKGKSLDHLLFQANEMSDEHKKFRTLEKRAMQFTYLVTFVAVVVPSLFGAYP